MWRAKLKFDKARRTCLPRAAAVAVVLTGCFATVSMAQAPRTFASPEEAVSAFFVAVQSSNEQVMLDILGPDAKSIVSSGDDAEDANDRANFVRRYLEMHRLVKEPDGSTTLYIGPHNWPMPIPIIGSGKSWHFDVEAAKKEILYRRVGKNEMSAIRVCRELVAAEKEYYSTQHGQYAGKILSATGQHDGLYWKTAGGEPKSPIGPLVASAVAGSDAGTTGPSTPFHGYYFHILTRQGKSASGGAKSYLVDGRLTGGFAFMAYPAEYRSSGVMTFIVGEDGVVYEKDQGTKTEAVAGALQEYNPDRSWRPSEDAQGKAAAGPARR
jgi:hypothetical protein